MNHEIKKTIEEYEENPTNNNSGKNSEDDEYDINVPINNNSNDIWKSVKGYSKYEIWRFTMPK